MNSKEVEQTIDELRKLTQQRDEITEQIEKIKIELMMKIIKEQTFEERIYNATIGNYLKEE